MVIIRSTRSAFTLLEVIFAIVIMGIVVASLPVMMGSNQKGIDTTIIQEAIFGASAELNQALSYRWDENSRDDASNPYGLSAVTETGDCNNTSSSSRFRLRPGHIHQPLHRRCVELSSTTPSNIGIEISDDGFADDVDDISTSSKPMFLNTGTASGYKQDFNSTFSISYTDMVDINASDKAAKYIEVTVTSKDGNITKLRSYTLNIGEVDFYKRTY